MNTCVLPTGQNTHSVTREHTYNEVNGQIYSERDTIKYGLTECHCKQSCPSHGLSV